MTTLIMVQTPEDVILGWDSLMTQNNEAQSLVQPKFFVNGGIIYGVSGTLRAADIIETTEFPKYDAKKYPDPRKWIIKEWTPVAMDALVGNPGLLDERGVLDGWNLMMVIGNQAFKLDTLLNPSQVTEGIYTGGSGGDYAWGALLYGQQLEGIDEFVVLDALGVAACIDPYSGGTLTVTKASNYLASSKLRK